MLTSTSSLVQQQLEYSRQALEAVEAYLRFESSPGAKLVCGVAPAPASKRFFTMLFSWGAF